VLPGVVILLALRASPSCVRHVVVVVVVVVVVAVVDDFSGINVVDRLRDARVACDIVAVVTEVYLVRKQIQDEAVCFG
jgi:hypothetical protein